MVTVKTSTQVHRTEYLEERLFFFYTICASENLHNLYDRYIFNTEKKNLFRGRAPGKIHPLPMRAFMCTRLKTCTLNTIHVVLKMRNFRGPACVGIKRFESLWSIIYNIIYCVYNARICIICTVQNESFIANWRLLI